MAHRQTHPLQLPLPLGSAETSSAKECLAQVLHPQIAHALSCLMLQVARAQRATSPTLPKEVGDERKS